MALGMYWPYMEKTNTPPLKLYSTPLTIFASAESDAET
jgi:hypothetical protein